MGIRYIAHVFESDETARVLDDPLSVIREEPFKAAWGPKACSTCGIFHGEPRPERMTLDLDKAWTDLQWMTRPAASGDVVRDAHRMFEGCVEFTCRGMRPWLRALAPADVVLVARDLETIDEVEVQRAVEARGGVPRDNDRAAYVIHHFRAARDFTVRVAGEGQGFVYMLA